MQIKKLRLKNFRQYIDQEITFSADQKNNVTLVIGDGGAGKTTLIQAITWNLYELVDFNNKVLLNSNVIQNMQIKSEKSVKVELFITHRGNDYIICREQFYSKLSNGSVKIIGTKLRMYQTIIGNQKPLSDIETYATIRSILPKDLSRYFFFDGEKIEKMSKEIETGKSQEFASAVQGLLGLSALQMVIKHLDPKKNGSVYGYYDSKIEEGSNKEVKDLRTSIEHHIEKVRILEEEVTDAEKNINYYKNEIEKIGVKLESFKSIEEIQKKYNDCVKTIIDSKVKKSGKVSMLLDNFHSSNTIAFLSKALIKETLEELKDKDKIDKGIPDIQDRTIDYLINVRKRCICGAPIEVDSTEYKSLIELKEFIPPKSVGGSINDLVKELQDKMLLTNNYFLNIKSYMADIRNEDNKIEINNKEIEEIDDNILGRGSEISELKKKQKEYELNISNLTNKIYSNKVEIGSFKEKINREETRRNNLIAQTNNNKIYSTYRNYAKGLYDEVYKDYCKKENIMRSEFENTINEIFDKIYGSGISISIDQLYNIKVCVNEVIEGDNDLDHSTSQNYSVIFAFIAAIMKLIREKKKDKDLEKSEGLEFSENYPLVMDAPLSSFDKDRIKNICTLLPNVAEQVIIFIKDTDGDIAKEHLKDRIGKLYKIQMNGLIDSRLIKEEQYV